MNIYECFLKLAQFEADSAALYQLFSEECSERLKPVLLTFSQEELKHKKAILELSNNEVLKEKELNEHEEKFFQKQVDDSNSNSKDINIASEKAFFRYALQTEKNSIDIYTKLQSIFDIDSYDYKSFETMIKEEKKHMLFILDNLYELV